ncbi:CorA metal ion transporter [Binucleata daphniae]
MNANTIMEIITIYRKMKKGRQNQNIYRMLLNVGSIASISEVDELVQTTPTLNNMQKNDTVYNFNKFRNLKETKYIFYSSETSLIQSDILFRNDNFKELLTKKFFWINIFNPTEKDLDILANVFNVHDITLIDIREGNTEEKIEIFKQYTFISLKLYSAANLKENEDIDFNILLYKDYVITTHDKPWGGINDILNFLFLIGTHTTLYPDWVLFSVIIEFLQDLKYIIDEMRPEINAFRDVSKADEKNIEDILRDNFDVVYRVHMLKNTIKPKVNILSAVKSRCKKRMRKIVSKQLTECLVDFKKQQKEVKESTKILERCQDLCLAIVNMVQSREGNAMNKSMKWFTMITFIFLPCQTVSGLWGMNCNVPGQDADGLKWFWFLTMIGPLLSVCYFVYTGMFLKNKQKRK